MNPNLKWYNNGKENLFTDEVPTDPQWVTGKLRRSFVDGEAYWNNGEITKTSIGSPGPEWVKGRIKKKM